MSAMRAAGMTVPDVFYGPQCDGDMARNYSDTTKSRKYLKWEPQVPFDEGLRGTVRFFPAAHKSGTI